MITINTTDAENLLKRCTSKEIDRNGQITKQVRKELAAVRATMKTELRARFKRDPRKMVRAVNGVQYKSIIGGTVSILNPRRPEKKYAIVVPNGGKSGKRRNRKSNEQTRRYATYYGGDRAFILRWINWGVARGSKAKGFFDKATPEMEKAGKRISDLFEKLIEQTSNEFK